MGIGYVKVFYCVEYSCILCEDGMMGKNLEILDDVKGSFFVG